MPLFPGKFSLKRPSPKKQSSLSQLNIDFNPTQIQEEFGLNKGPIKLNLGNNEYVFENGQWVIAGSQAHKDYSKLKKQNQELTEENNLLKLKVEMLMDMLAETTAEFHIQETVVEDLKKGLSNRR